MKAITTTFTTKRTKTFVSDLTAIFTTEYAKMFVLDLIATFTLVAGSAQLSSVLDVYSNFNEGVYTDGRDV